MFVNLFPEAQLLFQNFVRTLNGSSRALSTLLDTLFFAQGDSGIRCLTVHIGSAAATYFSGKLDFLLRAPRQLNLCKLWRLRGFQCLHIH